MRIELDDNDILDLMRELNFEFDEYTEPTEDMFKRALLEVVINRLVSHFRDEFLREFGGVFSSTYSLIDRNIAQLTKEHSDEIVDKTVEKVSNKILEKKKIKDEMPKASEINKIYKEWENFFSEMIDKAIKKKFS